jgi:adenosylmethionine-8-amino-7-oxononanoate aminotransferase
MTLLNVDGSGVGILAATSFLEKQHAFGCSLKQCTIIEAPLVDAFGENMTADETSKLVTMENSFLNSLSTTLKQQAENNNFHISCSVLVIEPIVGADGVWTYRPDFLVKVRNMCDTYKVHNNIHTRLIYMNCFLFFQLFVNFLT